jgi:hypothetical protein
MSGNKNPVSYSRAAGMGAVLSLIVIVISRALGNSPSDNSTVGYWGGVAIGGALIGVAVAAFRNRGRN